MVGSSVLNECSCDFTGYTTALKSGLLWNRWLASRVLSQADQLVMLFWYKKAFALWHGSFGQSYSDPEQIKPSWNQLDEVVLARFHSNPEEVLLESEHNWPSKQNKQPWYVLPGDVHQKIPRQYGHDGLVPFCIYLCGAVFSFIHSLKLYRFHCISQQLWNVFTYPNINEDFHLLAATVNPWLILLLSLSWCWPIMQSATSMHEAMRARGKPCKSVWLGPL